MKLIFKVLIILNCLFVAGSFGRALLLESEIEKHRVRLQAFAQENDLFPVVEAEGDQGSVFLQKYELKAGLFSEYMELLDLLIELRREQWDYYLYGQVGFLGFPVLGLIAFILSQRERDNLQLW